MIASCDVRRDGLRVADELLVQLLAGLGPTKSISMSRPGSWPERRIIFAARSTILTGSPMSSTKTSPPAHRARLQHELDRFGDRHEVARHLGVRDRDRAARARSAAEDRDHAAREPSTLPKRTATNRVLDVVAMPVASRRSTRERFDCAHDRGRVDRLVGRDEHEALGADSTATSATCACRACCCAPPRPGSPPSSARACARRRGRRRRAGSLLEDLAHLRAASRRRRATGTAA